jgi:hypothetical protein
MPEVYRRFPGKTKKILRRAKISQGACETAKIRAPTLFFRQPSSLILRVLAQAGYGDKRTS